MSYQRNPHGSECKYAEGPSRLTPVAFITITPCCGICVDLNFLDGHVHGKGYEIGKSLNRRRVPILGPTQDVGRELRWPFPFQERCSVRVVWDG
eukprot:5508029-Pyramimonas_sp.AAC.1